MFYGPLKSLFIGAIDRALWMWISYFFAWLAPITAIIGMNAGIQKNCNLPNPDELHSDESAGKVIEILGLENVLLEISVWHI